MKSRINQILKDIESKKEELLKEYWNMKEKYWFSFIKWKLKFDNSTIKNNKNKKNSIIDSIFSTELREILAGPFIYSMVFPIVILDIFLFIYQNIAFRLYKIPLVSKREFITYDRKELDYLNAFQKFNCLYCAYVNGFLSYAVEVAWRTERYWCPIKHANKMSWWHYWQKHFADYWDPEWFRETFCKFSDNSLEEKSNINEKKDIT